MTETPSAADERLFSGYTGRLLALITSGSLLASMVGLVLPPLLPTIMAELALTPARAGVLMTVWWLSIALLNFPGGRLADTLSHKTILVVGLGLATVGLATLTAAGGFVALAVGVAVVGAGRGLYQPASITQISTLFVARRGQALGIRNAAFNFGGVVAGGLAIAALHVASWRAAFVPVLVGLVPVAVLLHRWSRERYVLARVSFDVRATGRRLVGSGRVRWLVAVLALYGFAWNGVTSFLPAFLEFEKGFTATAASTVFASLFLVGGIVQPFAGGLGDRVGYARAATIAAGLSALGLAVLVLAATPIAVVAAVVVLGAGLAAFWPVMIAHGMATLPDDTRGGDWGAITAIYIGIESVGSSYVGVVVERLGYTVAYASLLVCFLAAVAIARRLARTDR